MAQLNPGFVLDKNDIDSFEQIQLENDTQLARENLLMHKAYKEPSDNDLIKNNCSSFTFVDFCPQLKRGGSGSGSGSGKITRAAGFAFWHLETFSQLFDRINVWLQLNDQWRVKSAETLIYDEATQFNHKSTSFNGCSLQLLHRAIRLWLVPAKNRFSGAQKIGCINVVPRARSSLASFSSSSGQHKGQNEPPESAYETLDEILKRLNDLLINRPIEGRILSVETITLPINGGYVDTEINYNQTTTTTTTTSNSTGTTTAGQQQHHSSSDRSANQQQQQQTDMIDVLRVYYEFGPFRCGLVKMIDFVPQSISPLAPIPNNSNNSDNNNKQSNCDNNSSVRQPEQAPADNRHHGTLSVASLPNFESLTALIKRSVTWFQDNQHNLSERHDHITVVGSGCSNGKQSTTTTTTNNNKSTQSSDDVTTNIKRSYSFGEAKFCNIQIRQKPLRDCWLLHTTPGASQEHSRQAPTNAKVAGQNKADDAGESRQQTSTDASASASVREDTDRVLIGDYDDKLNEIISSQFNTRNMFYPSHHHHHASSQPQNQVNSSAKVMQSKDNAPAGSEQRIRRKSTPTKQVSASTLLALTPIEVASVGHIELDIGSTNLSYEPIKPMANIDEQRPQQSKLGNSINITTTTKQRRNTIHWPAINRQQHSVASSTAATRCPPQLNPQQLSSGGPQTHYKRTLTSQQQQQQLASSYQLKFVRLAYVLPIIKTAAPAATTTGSNCGFERCSAITKSATIASNNQQQWSATTSFELIKSTSSSDADNDISSRSAADCSLGDESSSSSDHDFVALNESTSTAENEKRKSCCTELTYRLFAPSQVINNSSAFVNSNQYSLPTVTTTIHANPIYTVGRVAAAMLTGHSLAGTYQQQHHQHHHQQAYMQPTGTPPIYSFGGLMPAFVTSHCSPLTSDHNQLNNSEQQQTIDNSGSGSLQPATYDVLPLMMSSYNHQLIGSNDQNRCAEQFESVESMKKRLQVYVTSNAMKVLSAETLIVRLTNNNSSLTTAIDNCLSNTNQLLSQSQQSPMSSNLDQITLKGAWVCVYILYCDASDNRLANNHYSVANDKKLSTHSSASHHHHQTQEEATSKYHRHHTVISDDDEKNLCVVSSEGSTINKQQEIMTSPLDNTLTTKIIDSSSCIISGHDYHQLKEADTTNTTNDNDNDNDRVLHNNCFNARDNYYSSNDYKPFVRTIPLPSSPDDIQLDDNGLLKQQTTTASNINDMQESSHWANRDQCSVM